ncbi:MAG TPA: cyclic nucleotide-binding domain-containing protein [Kofleriaceae bacterium]|nr:cyclic nucleotide-binding domain-containing protein [Kofleriaceae bacterium]
MRLGAFPVFSELEPAQLAPLADLTRERFYRAGATVQARGVPPREIHYVIEGEVEIRPDGGPPTRLGPLAVVNRLSALAGVGRTDDVVAVADTVTLSFTRDDQEDVFEEHFEILARVMREVAGAYLDAWRAAPDHVAGEPADGSIPDHLGLVAKIAALRAARLFDESPLEALAELARESPEVRYPAGKRLWSAGDAAGWSLAIVSGRVAGTVEGASEALGFGPASIPGLLDGMAGRARWFDAETETPIVGLRIDGGGLLDLLEDHADMSLQLMRSLSREVITLRAAAAAA